MATSQEIKISIVSALNAAGIDATKKQISQMTKSVSGDLKGMTTESKTHMADFKAGFDLMCTGVKAAWSALTAGINSAFKFETQTTQFKTLIGDIDEAKRHMQDLKALGDTPPFSLDQFAAASRQMMVMTDGALGYKRSLELVGDAAAATGMPIEQMGHAVGRLYAFIRDGQPLSRAVTELRNMGAITPEVAQKLQDLQNAGASNADIWAEVEKQLGRYNGAMAETEKTGDGMIGAIESRWDNIVRAFGQAFENASKGGLKSVLDKMKELEQSGTLEVWASKVAAAISKVVDAAKVAAEWGGKLVDAFKWVQDTGSAVGSSVGSAVGTIIGGGSLKEAMNNAVEEFAKMTAETEAVRAEEEEMAKAIRERKQADIEAAKAAEESARADEEKSRVTKQLAESQMKKMIDDQVKESEEEEKRRTKEKAESDKLWADVYKDDLSDATKMEADAREKAAKAAKDLEYAEVKLKDAVKKYEDNIAQNLINEGVVQSAILSEMKGGMFNGHGDFLKSLGAIAEAAGSIAARNALNDGKIRTVADYDKAYKQAAKEARIAANDQAVKEGMDAKAAARIAAMPEKARSKKDQEFLDKWKQVNAANKKQKEDMQKAQQEAAAAKKRKEDAEKAMAAAAKDIAEIKKKLNDLGLK